MPFYELAVTPGFREHLLGRDKFVFFDDFLGGNWDNRAWNQSTTGAGTVTKIVAEGGQVELVGNTYAALHMGNPYNLSLAKRLSVSGRARYVTIDPVACRGTFYVANFSTSPWDFLTIYYDPSVSTNWRYESCHTDAGHRVTLDSGILAGDTNWHEFEIVGTTDEVRYFVDGALAGAITESDYPGCLPTDIMGGPFLAISDSAHGGSPVMRVDWMLATGDRD
jgi:hypothetical protein